MPIRKHKSQLDTFLDGLTVGPAVKLQYVKGVDFELMDGSTVEFKKVDAGPMVDANLNDLLPQLDFYHQIKDMDVKVDLRKIKQESTKQVKLLVESLDS